jgi:DNA-directed RNA polymerase specialized sigma24 family protein
METTNTALAPAAQLDEVFYAALYDDVFPVVASIISRQGGNRTEAEDIFQDAIIALLDAHQRTHIADHRRYIVGIAKHLWLRRSGSGVRFLSLDDFERSLSIPDSIPAENTPSPLLRVLQRTGSKCLDLLSDFYFAGLTLAQVTLRHSFHNTHSAAVQKHKCVEKLRTVVKEKSLSYEDLAE